MHKFFRTVLSIALVWVMCGVVFADAGGGTDGGSGAPLSVPTGWPGVIMLACMLAGGLLRHFTDETDDGIGKFFHSPAGLVVSAFLLGAVGLIMPAVQHGMLSKQALEGLLFTAAFSALTMWKPGKGAAAVFLPLVFVFGLTGCPGATALGRCELSKLPSTLSSLIASIASIASQPAGYLQDLEDLGKKVAPDQIDCISVALATEAAKPGHPTWRGDMGVHLREYIDKRKAAGAKLSCAPAFLRDVRATYEDENRRLQWALHGRWGL